jgi:hypothetical protein
MSIMLMRHYVARCTSREVEPTARNRVVQILVPTGTQIGTNWYSGENVTNGPRQVDWCAPSSQSADHHGVLAHRFGMYSPEGRQTSILALWQVSMTRA